MAICAIFALAIRKHFKFVLISGVVSETLAALDEGIGGKGDAEYKY
jgi:hypothetical protein